MIISGELLINHVNSFPDFFAFCNVQNYYKVTIGLRKDSNESIMQVLQGAFMFVGIGLCKRLLSTSFLSIMNSSLIREGEFLFL